MDLITGKGPSRAPRDLLFRRDANSARVRIDNFKFRFIHQPTAGPVRRVTLTCPTHQPASGSVRAPRLTRQRDEGRGGQLLHSICSSMSSGASCSSRRKSRKLARPASTIPPMQSRRELQPRRREGEDRSGMNRAARPKAPTVIATAARRPDESPAKIEEATYETSHHAIVLALLRLRCRIHVMPHDPLPSWNDTAPKKAIVAFVEKVTKEGSPDFVPPAERIATFDNDGTLWAEQPMYFQLALRARPREGAGAAASRVEGQGALRLAAQGRRERRARRRRDRPSGRSSWPRTRA